MRLLTFATDEGPRAGTFVSDGTILAIRALVPGAPIDMLRVIEQFDALGPQIRDAAARAHGGVDPKKAKLLAPIPVPRRNVLCVGWNYTEHFQEGAGLRGPQDASEKKDLPEFPALFSKNPATVTGPDTDVLHPAPYSEQLDWEVELAVIVGRPGRDIPEAESMRHVFGYTCANDVSVRDIQRRHGGQWYKGKNFDTHLPMGPWIVTADEIDPSNLRVQTRVNGVTKQDSTTKFMVFKTPRLIADFSAGSRLEAGDIIITGTPEGVGFARKPPEFMKVGDVVEVEIEKIGVLRNTVATRP
jgi:2-keto-4-pentenoate hydratase/2-oxohepta-3-ene-1,7-dioic acid hydratase in catechol pathway